MMNKSKTHIKIEEAEEEVRIAIERIALLHLAYAETLISVFGSDKGKEVILKAIFNYGDKIGQRVKKGKRDLPSFGVYKEDVKTNENGDFIVKGCQLAKIFKEYKQLELGALYCFVDPAKSMSIDNTKKVIHKSCEACGDDECTLAIVETTKKERESFEKGTNFERFDSYLI